MNMRCRCGHEMHEGQCTVVVMYSQHRYGPGYDDISGGHGTWRYAHFCMCSDGQDFPETWRLQELGEKVAPRLL